MRGYVLKVAVASIGAVATACGSPEMVGTVGSPPHEPTPSTTPDAGVPPTAPNVTGPTPVGTTAHAPDAKP